MRLCPSQTTMGFHSVHHGMPFSHSVYLRSYEYHLRYLFMIPRARWGGGGVPTDATPCVSCCFREAEEEPMKTARSRCVCVSTHLLAVFNKR